MYIDVYSTVQNDDTIINYTIQYTIIQVHSYSCLRMYVHIYRCVCACVRELTVFVF